MGGQNRVVIAITVRGPDVCRGSRSFEASGPDAATTAAEALRILGDDAAAWVHDLTVPKRRDIRDILPPVTQCPKCQTTDCVHWASPPPDREGRPE